MDDRQLVLQAELDLAAAHLTLDLNAFERLLHPGYVIVLPGGVVEGKRQVLASLRSGSRRWQIARSDEMSVRVFHDTAVVVGRWTGVGSNAGAPFDYQARFLSVWTKEEGHWRNLTSQSTPIDDIPRAAGDKPTISEPPRAIP